MRETWERAYGTRERLASADEAVHPLLTFYSQLLGLQRDIATLLTEGTDAPASGSLEQDKELLRPGIRRFSKRSQQAARNCWRSRRSAPRRSQTAIDELLTTCWHHPSDRQFFAKAVLQPYARWLADAQVIPVDRHLTMAESRCPFCGGAPQLSILHGAGGPLEGGGRSLLCATCLTVWPFRRVVCAHCGEEDERRLGYFQSPSYDHLRIDACDSCRRYLKSVDLTRLGVAVPLVDEVAGAPLDLWAREQGYEKIELNLVGL